jgi:thiol-disulfide isomerase/thioredoxin
MRLIILSMMLLTLANAAALFQEFPGHPVCKDSSGRPKILMFSANTCPVCQTMIPVFRQISEEYDGKIYAALWQLDAGTDQIDNLLTSDIETEVALDDDKIRQEFLAYSPGIPRFIFGCRYYRSGQQYTGTGWQEKELAEMRQAINQLIPECVGSCTDSPGCCATGCKHSEDPDCLHEADTDESGCLDNSELLSFLTRWRGDKGIALGDLVDAISLWKSC